MRFPTNPFVMAAVLATILTGIAVVAVPNLQTVILSTTITPVGTATPTATPGSIALPPGTLTETGAISYCLNGQLPSIGPASAHVLSPGQASQIQTTLDTYGVVRLQPGDYRAGPATITITSGQELFGMPGTIVNNVSVAAGTTNAIVDDLQLGGSGGGSISFAAGAVTSQNCFERLQGTAGYTHVLDTGAIVENNIFLRVNGYYAIDNSGGGDLKDNRFIGTKSGQKPPSSSFGNISIKGDAANGSDDNVFLWLNNLTGGGNSIYLDHQADLALVALEAESWDTDSTATQAMLTTGSMGTLRLLGAHGCQNVTTSPALPTYDIAATEVDMYTEDICDSQANPDFVYESTSQRSSALKTIAHSITDHASGASRMTGFVGTGTTLAMNGTTVTGSSLSSAQQSTLRQMYVNPTRSGVPWETPTFGPVPDPAGPSWQTTYRSGSSCVTDNTSYIQNLVNTSAGNVAILPAGIYCISSPLLIPQNGGIMGADQGTTDIIAANNTLDMFVGNSSQPTNCNNTTGCEYSYVLADVTLQGGNNGIVLDGRSGRTAQISDSFISHVTFRDMANAGMYISDIWGLDNNLLDNLTFYQDGAGVKQIAPGTSNGNEDQTYLDKNIFYHDIFSNNSDGWYLRPNRQNNDNACIDCLFGGNTSAAADIQGSDGTTFANSAFTGNGGNPVVSSTYAATAFVGDDFRAGTQGTTMLGGAQFTVEGSTFERAGSSTATMISSLADGFFYNSTSADMPLGTLSNGILLNTSLPADPSLNNQGVSVSGGTATTFLPGTPVPAPQLLVGSAFTTTVAGGPAPTPTPLATPVPPRTMPASLFADDFEHQGLAPWSPVGGSWSICHPLPGSGNHAYCDTDTSGNGTKSLAGSREWANYAVQATVGVGSAANAGVSLLGRVRDANNYYQLELDPTSWDLSKIVGGAYTSMVSGPFTLAANTPYMLNLTFQGSTILAGLSTDGGTTWQTLANVSDSTFSSGQIGLNHYGSLAWFDNVTVASNPLFATGFEAGSGQPQPTWTDTVDSAGGGVLNVGPIVAGPPGPETGVRTNESYLGTLLAHTGTSALLYSGGITSTVGGSYAYTKVFDLTPSAITVGPTTTLSYWIYPQSPAENGAVSSNNSSCVGVDLIFTDGTTLRNKGAVDQNGVNLHPASRCGHLTLDTWNYVTSTIGSVAAGETIARLDVGYDHAASAGGYRGYIDDITLAN